MSRRLVLVALSGLLLFGSACSKRMLPTDPSAGALSNSVLESPNVRIDPERARGAAQVFGRTRSGAFYALFRPERWNGDLVLYAHGYVAPFAPVALPTSENVEPVRDLLLARGFAVAYSSYSANGLPVQDAIRTTAQLEQLFTARLGHPRRIFLNAHSFGGLVVVALAERYPHHYAGVLATSGLVGGIRKQVDYVANIRVLFDYFYPGALPGDLLNLPSGLDLNHDIIGPAVAAMSAHPEGAGAIALILGIPYRTGPELVGVIVQGLVFQAIELQDLLARTGGQSFFDNSTTIYSGALPPALLADLNTRVARFTSTPEVKAFFARYYEPSGELEIPMITLHSRFDPSVPVFNETAYAALVKAHGDSDLLDQRFTDEPQHVTYPAAVTVAAFEELVQRADQLRKHGRSKHRESVAAQY